MDSKGHQGDSFGRFAGIDGGGFEKFLADGNIPEQGFNLDGRALRSGCWVAGDHFAAVHDDHGADRCLVALLGRACQQVEFGDGGDGRDGFSPEAHGGERVDLLHFAQLGGGMALEAEEGVIGIHAAAVVADADHLASAALDFNADVG